MGAAADAEKEAKRTWTEIWNLNTQFVSFRGCDKDAKRIFANNTCKIQYFPMTSLCQEHCKIISAII
jgi:hypothetical protein